MLFHVVIPTGAKPEQLLRIRSPDGTEGDVRMPSDLSAGDSFYLEMAMWEGTSSLSEEEHDDASSKNYLTRGQLEAEMAAERDIFAVSFYRNVHVETVDPSASTGKNGTGVRRRRAATNSSETVATAIMNGSPPPRILIHRAIPVELSQELGYQFGCAASSSSESSSASSSSSSSESSLETCKTNNPSNSSKSGRLSISLTTTSSSSSSGSEPVSRADFLAALLIGFFIGMSIVGGFIVGVLLVTEP